MPRIVLVAIAAAALAGCGTKAAQHPVAQATAASAVISDPRGDAVDADGNPRRGRPDVDVVRVGIDRNADRTLFTITAAGKPRGPLHYEIFGQASEVAGYDVVSITRKGDSVTGYVAFENSVARQRLSAPQSLSLNGPTLAVNVPIDPIFGADPFGWRVTVSTAGGPRIFDYLPSPGGTKSFPPP